MQEPRMAEKSTAYWWEAAPVKPVPRQGLTTKLDVLIVGAGFAGLSAGLALARAGRSVGRGLRCDEPYMLPRLFVKYATGFCGSSVIWAPWIGMRAASKLMGHSEQARTAFDFRPPACVPFYRGNPWFMPAIIRGYGTASRSGAPAADGPGRHDARSIIRTDLQRRYRLYPFVERI